MLCSPLSQPCPPSVPAAMGGWLSCYLQKPLKWPEQCIQEYRTKSPAEPRVKNSSGLYFPAQISSHRVKYISAEEAVLQTPHGGIKISTQYAGCPKYPKLNLVEASVINFQGGSQGSELELPSFHTLTLKESNACPEVGISVERIRPLMEVCLGTTVLLSSVLSIPSGCVS